MSRLAFLLLALSIAVSPAGVANAFAEESPGVPMEELTAAELLSGGLDGAIEFALPSELGPVSIDESRRALRADIEDWSDDYRGLKNRRLFVCALSGITLDVWSGLDGVGGARAAIRVLDRYTRMRSGPSAPLHLPIREVLKNVPLTDAEREALERLLRREPEDMSDRIRLAIDFQSVLMRVSVRLYDEAIKARLAKSGGWRELWSPGKAKCEALSLQMERDQELIRAARGVLGLFDFLELELRD